MIVVGTTMAVAKLMGINLPHMLIGGTIGGRGLLGAAFNDLVEFAAIQPDSPALGAVINFDSLPLGHQQISGGTYGAFH
jgi:hypothetical protein